jgi:hypothetical protein
MRIEIHGTRGSFLFTLGMLLKRLSPAHVKVWEWEVGFSKIRIRKARF